MFQKKGIFFISVDINVIKSSFEQVNIIIHINNMFMNELSILVREAAKKFFF